MDNVVISDLLINAMLLISLCWLHGVITFYSNANYLPKKILSGMLFGFVCILGMSMPLVLVDGLIFDGRAVVLSMSALFGGALVGLIAGSLAAIYRWWIGGVGHLTGILNILMPVILGLMYRYLRLSGRVHFSFLTLAVFSACLQILQLYIISFVPIEKFHLFINHGLVPFVIVNFSLTLLIGFMLRDNELKYISRQALLQSESQLRAISNAVPDVSLVLDEDGRYLRINTSDESLLFANSDQLEGRLINDVLPESQAKLLMQFILRTIESDSLQSVEYCLSLPTGKRVFEARARRLDVTFEGKRAVLLMARDITVRLNLEKYSRIASIAFESKQGMLITDDKIRVLKVNKAFSKITGFSEEDVIGKPSHMLGYGLQESNYFDVIMKVLSEDGVWEGEILTRSKSGAVFPGWLTISAVPDDQGLVTNHVVSLIDISERKIAEQQIHNLAFYDPLTGLPNRRLLHDRLHQAMVSCARNGQYAALIFIDLDDFKNVNDLHGHQVGDQLLCQVANRLKFNLREFDTVARLGGDEFVILLEGLDPCAEDAGSKVESIGSKLLSVMRDPYCINTKRLIVHASLGVVIFNDNQHTVDELMKRADLAMYSRKAEGKNALSFYDPQMQTAVSLRLKLEEEIRNALENGEFLIYVQAQVGLSGQVEGAEALVRWHHPLRGVLAPAYFISIAERCGFIDSIDLSILKQGCELLARWAKISKLSHLSLAINISPKLINRSDFVDTVKHILVSSQANPLNLKLEITESILLDNMDKAVANMEALQALGIRFSIDDFGTGYSSMAYLQKLPFDQLKIDQSFIRDLPDSSSSLAIVRAILAMAHSLQLEVIAEGVEIQAQYDELRNNGCNHFQGYLFGRPVDVETFESMQLSDALNIAFVEC